MINSDQIHVAMTKMRGWVATPVCQSNILLKQVKERAIAKCVCTLLETCTNAQACWTVYHTFIVRRPAIDAAVCQLE
jgi:hypothetical protein